MVERYQRGKGKQKLLGSHQKCWIWGRHAVFETLRAGTWPILELHLADRLSDEEQAAAESLAEQRGVIIQVDTTEALTSRCHSGEHQGYLAKMPEFPYADLDTLLESRPETPAYVLLDGVQDPYNFGAILRSADALGADAVFIGERNQVGVTSLVARSSAGAVNHVPIVRVQKLVALASLLQSLGVRLIGTDGASPTPLDSVDFKKPSTMIIGNEGRGIALELLAACDETVSIPQVGHVASLNAAVATGVVLYEMRRQRGQNDRA
jgi:23S rRNA (guanosine2251-2'-O)-methyltransferase